MLHRDILEKIISDYQKLKELAHDCNTQSERKIFNSQLKIVTNSIGRLDLESESAIYNSINFSNLLSIHSVTLEQLRCYAQSHNILSKEIDPILSTWKPEYHLMKYINEKNATV